MILQITEKNYNEEILKSDIPVIIDFYAKWCEPCGIMEPVIEEIKLEQSDKVKVCQVNVEQEEKLAENFNITNIPTIVIMKNGKIVTRLIGVQNKEEILNKINN